MSQLTEGLVQGTAGTIVPMRVTEDGYILTNEDSGTFSHDASSRLRVSLVTTLFDGKVLNSNRDFSFNFAGTGTNTFEDNKHNLSVTSGQYLIKQSKVFTPYFAGKSQLIEVTFDRFQNQPGTIKRAGYFSSATTGNYDSEVDGVYIESDGINNKYRIVVSNSGVISFNLELSQWINSEDFINYDFTNFTVVAFDFLWLGGALLRCFIKHPTKGFLLCCEYNFAGTSEDVFMKTPQQPVRYEIRSTSGSASFRSICNQVSTEGSLSERGFATSIFNPSLLSTNTVGTTYVLKAIRKTTTNKNTSVRVVKYGGVVSTSDSGILTLLLNPTLSSSLTFQNNSTFQEATGTGQTVVSNGKVLSSLLFNTSGASTSLIDGLLSEVGINIDGTSDVIVLAYSPLTINQSVSGNIDIIEY